MDTMDWTAVAAAWDEFVRVAALAVAAYVAKLAKDAIRFYVIDKVMGRAAGLVVGEGKTLTEALGYARRSLPRFLAKQTDDHVAEMIQGQVGKLTAPAEAAATAARVAGLREVAR